MKYVLAEISRRSIGLFYNEGNGSRTFVPFGSNGPIPLALCSINGEFQVGEVALQAVEDNREDAFFNLFDLAKSRLICNGKPAREFAVEAILVLLDDLCHEAFYSSLNEMAFQMTLILSYSNDIMSVERDLVDNILSAQSFAKLESVVQSSLAVDFFVHSPSYEWGMEENAMIVSSDNKDLSVKCVSLSDGRLLYEKLFQERGCDPRYEWAVKNIWEDVSTATYCTEEQAMPMISKVLDGFLKSGSMELTSVKLPDGADYSTYLNKSAYENFCPANGNQLVSLIADVVKEVGLEYATTGIILQNFTSQNKYFHESFNQFDPISDETIDCSNEIRNQLLRNLLDEKPIEFKGVARKPKIAQPVYSVFDVQPEVETPLSVISEPEHSSEATSTPKPSDDINRRFMMESSVTSEGKMFKKKNFLSISVEVLDGKSLPFDCVFTIDDKNFKTYKPDESFCADCKKGTSGRMEFGPYDLPFSEFKDAKVLYAHIWPADKKQSPNVFKNNHLTIKL